MFCDAVTSVTSWRSCAATSRESVVTPARTGFKFVAAQLRQKLARSFMTVSTRQATVDDFFTLATRATPRQLSALLTGH